MTDPQQKSSPLAPFVAELKRRHVVRFTLGYAAAAFVLLQLAEIVFPAFGVDETGLRLLVIAVALLFPPAAVLAWVFDITAEGIKRTEDPAEGRGSRASGSMAPRVALLAVTVVILGGVGLWMARVGLIEELTSPAPDAGAEAPLELVAYDPSDPIRSLAVLPLDDFSGSDDDDYFSAGLLDELTAQLSQIAGLRVVSRTSVMRYAGTATPIPQIGRELQVDAVIEGSVRRVDDRVRITVQLIHAASDTHVWTQQYDRSLGDVLALQSEVALDIARQISAELSPEESTLLGRTAARDVAPAAQDAYLRGRYELDKGTPEGYRAALDWFGRAVSEDTGFAPALAGLAGARFVLGMSSTEPAEEDLRRAEEEARKALAMDSMSVEAREVFRLIRLSMPDAPSVAGVPGVSLTPDVPVPFEVGGLEGALLDTAWASAMTQLGRRIETQVRVATARTDRAGRVGRALAARQLMAAGRFEEAAALLADLAEEEPEHAALWETLARARLAAGDPAGAVAAIASWSASGADGAPTAREVQSLRASVSERGPSAYWSWMHARLEARTAAGERVSAADRAAALVGMGEVDRAFAALGEAVRRHDPGLVSLRSDPVWDPVRADRRFTEIARQARALRPPPGPRP